MNVLVFLIPMAILLGLVGLYGLFWTLKRGQYEDLQGSAYRILLDDDIEDAPKDAPKDAPEKK